LLAVSCGWAEPVFTQQNRSAVHVLRLSPCEFYGRVRTKKITVGRTFIAPENVSVESLL